METSRSAGILTVNMCSLVSYTYAGNISGTGGLIVTSSGIPAGSGGSSGGSGGINTLILTGSNSYTGTTVNSGATLEVATTSALPNYSVSGGVSVTSGAILAVDVGGSIGWGQNNVANLVSSTTFPAGSTLGFDTGYATGGSFSYSNSLGFSGGVCKLGGGTLILTGSDNYAGTTTIAPGPCKPARPAQGRTHCPAGRRSAFPT